MSPRLLTQPANVDVVTPTTPESLDFGTRVGWLDCPSRDGQLWLSAGVGSHRFDHMLVLTDGPQPALGHVGWRADGPEALAAAVAPLEGAGAAEG
jgi:catechol 2,3-dioxygenase